MTHAARSHAAFERLQQITDQLEELRNREAELKEKLAHEQRQAEITLLLADVASILKDVDTRNLSEGKRLRLNGVRHRVLDMMRVA